MGTRYKIVPGAGVYIQGAYLYIHKGPTDILYCISTAFYSVCGARFGGSRPETLEITHFVNVAQLVDNRLKEIFDVS